MESFEKELRNLINSHSKENASNTPDYILAAFMNSCLTTFNVAMVRRDIWWQDDLRHFNKSITPSHVCQLTQCMPAELRTQEATRPLQSYFLRNRRHITQDAIEGGTLPRRIETLLRPEECVPHPAKPWRPRLVSYKGVEGHKVKCEIELAFNWKACTCRTLGK